MKKIIILSAFIIIFIIVLAYTSQAPEKEEAGVNLNLSFPNLQGKQLLIMRAIFILRIIFIKTA
jgi:hypothetical protein